MRFTDFLRMTVLLSGGAATLLATLTVLGASREADPALVIFEAPQKEQQVQLIKRFGPDVNLGNIPPADVLPLETMRLGLRSDTMETGG